MAVGDLCDIRGDVEFAGFRFTRFPEDMDGSFPEGVFYGDSETEWSGWDLPESRDTDQEADGDGDMYGAERIQARIVSVSGLWVSGRTAMLSLRTAMLRRTTEVPLCVRGMGPAPTDDTVLFGYARPRRFAYAEDNDAHTHELYRVDCEWKCADPRLYSLTETETTVDGTNPTVANAGNVEAPLRWVTTGAATGPRLRRISDDLLVDFDGLTVSGGQTLTWSTRIAQAFLSTGADRIGYADDGTGKPAQMWGIPAGGATVGYAADSGASSASVFVRAAYL